MIDHDTHNRVLPRFGFTTIVEVCFKFRCFIDKGVQAVNGNEIIRFILLHLGQSAFEKFEISINKFTADFRCPAIRFFPVIDFPVRKIGKLFLRK